MTVRSSFVTAAALVVLAAASGKLSAQATHRIELAKGIAANDFQFKPARIRAHPGDILVFRVTGGGNHSIVFEADGIPAAVRTALGAAMPRRVGDLAGPLFGPEAEYRIVLPALPAGEYRFYCLPHRAYDETAVLVVE